MKTTTNLKTLLVMSVFLLPGPWLAGPALADGAWDIQTVDSTGDVGRYTSIALDANDYTYISYFDWTNGDLKYAAFNGSTWDIETVDSTGTVGWDTSIALDADGYSHISYHDWTNDDLKYAAFNGSTWDIETVDSTGDVGRNTSMALDANDNPHISYFDYTNYDLKYAAWNGSGWDIQTVDSTGFVGSDTSIALDEDGYPHISYLVEPNWDLKYAAFNGSTWDIETVDSTGDVGLTTSIALDADGHPHISYFDATNDDLKYAAFNGSTWDIQTVDSTGNVGAYTSLALDADGHPHISYCDLTNGDLKYAAFNGSTWDIQTVDITTWVGTYTSIALDGSGYAHISYFDDTNNDLKYAFAPEPTTYYVDADATGANDGSSWENAFNYLQDALAAASSGDQILVAEGTYKPDANSTNPDGTSDRTATFQLISGVAIYGGYAGFGEPDPNERDPNDPNNETILSGDLYGNDGPDFANNAENSYHVVTCSETDETAVLDGFTIAAGNANASSPDPNSQGGGMFNDRGSPRVTNCTFSGNSAHWLGGGMFNKSSNPTVTNCTFSSNKASHGGGIGCQLASPTIINCTFSGNSASWGGGGICNEYSNPKLTNCTFSDNSAEEYGGAMCNWQSSPTVTNCTFSGNSATYAGGAMLNHESSPTITNCIFTGNSALLFDGGGMCNWQSSPTVTNCTFSDNSATYEGGGMFNDNSSPTITNCTFSDNSAMDGGGMFNWEESSPILTNCTFNENSASWGGAMCNLWSSPTVTNCTFSGNSATYEEGGGMLNHESSPMVTNCILWRNTPEQISGRAVITYSDIQGGWRGEGNINADPLFVDPNGPDGIAGTEDDNLQLMPDSPCIDAGDNSSVPTDIHDLDGDGNTTEPIPFDLDGNPRIVDGNDDGIAVVDMGAYEYEAMVSCFGVNHLKLETKAGKKGNKVELKGTFSPALPIDFAVDDVAYIIDDGQGNALAFLIPAGSFEPEGKPDKQKFKFHSPKGSQPDINARFDFDKCKFELKAKGVMDTDEITGTTLTIELWAGANVVEEVVQVQVKPRHTEYKREPKLSCCPKCKGIALLEVTSTDPFTGDEYVLLFEPDPGKEKLKRKTVIDDGVNGPVKIDTSCSKPIDVGDVFGVYTVTDLIKIFDD